MTLKMNAHIGILAVLLGLGSGTATTAQEACSTYVVQDGDTLGAISMAAYGALQYQLLFNANADLLRDDPTDLNPGEEIRIPCADGRMTKGQVIQPIAEVVAAETAVAETSSGDYHAKIRILTGNGWFPYVDETLSGGGAMVRLATTAMKRGGNDYAYSVNWVDDWVSHMESLLPSGGYDFSVAWYIPDCSHIDQASDLTRDTCLNFIFSDPLYDSVFGFFMAKDSPFSGARTFEDLKGARICRPEGYSMHDLEAEGLVEPAITLLIPYSAEECFEGLVDGTIDVATVESQLSVITIQTLGLSDQIVENPNISSIQSAAAVAWKANPKAREILDIVNRGLAEMRSTGEWNTIVSGSLAEADEIQASWTN